METISVEHLHTIIQQAIKRQMPEVVEIRYKSGGRQVFPTDVERIVDAITKHVKTIVVEKVDTTYLVEQRFEYAVTIDIDDL